MKDGFTVLVDAQKASWRLTKDYSRIITQLLGINLEKLIILRPDVFSVHNCTKVHKKSEVRNKTLLIFLQTLFHKKNYLNFSANFCV